MRHFTHKKNSLKTFNRNINLRKKSNKKVALPTTSSKPSEPTVIPTISKTTGLDEQTIKINNLLDETTDRLDANNASHHVPSFTPNPDEYNGVSSGAESYKILHQEISTDHRKTQELEERLRIIQLDFDREKAELTETIGDLKRELHRTKPIHDTALFTLTRELRDSVSMMDQFLNENPIQPSNSILQAQPVITTTTPDPVTQTLPTAATTPRTVTKSQPPTTSLSEATVDKVSERKGKKGVISAVLGITLLTVVSAGLAYSFMKKPSVDQELVEEYLQKNATGQVAGATNVNPSGMPSEVKPSSTVMNMAKLEAEIPFEQTIWDTIKEPNFKIKLQYPANATEILKTDSNITFLRKDGYLFKIQRIETALTPEEYWKQVKATSLNYKDSKTKYLNREALLLELDDITDYPGNRYLVKEGNFLFDIWYATEGEAFSKDDIRRAKYMLDTVSFESG